MLGAQRRRTGRPILPPKGLNPEAIDAIQNELLNLCNAAAIQPPYHPLASVEEMDDGTRPLCCTRPVARLGCAEQGSVFRRGEGVSRAANCIPSSLELMARPDRFRCPLASRPSTHEHQSGWAVVSRSFHDSRPNPRENRLIQDRLGGGLFPMGAPPPRSIVKVKSRSLLCSLQKRQATLVFL